VIPDWLHVVSIASLLLRALCFVVILTDIIRHPQHMGIMNVVWPVTALFGTIWVTWQYVRYGRLGRDKLARAAMDRGEPMPSLARTPFPIMVANGALHCGSGCMLGDICAEWLVFLAPSVAVFFGWHWLFGREIFAAWVVDFVFAYAFGVVFQYFSIKPMRDLTPGKAIWAAIKADTLSLTSWQIGMYGFMAFANFYVFHRVLGTTMQTDTPEFWFAMQIAMLCGFATAYPMNWLLIRTGVKEKM
jgi:hypothetical protein